MKDLYPTTEATAQGTTTTVNYTFGAAIESVSTTTHTTKGNSI